MRHKTVQRPGMYATIGSIGTYTTLPMYICKQLCTYALILVRLVVRIMHKKRYGMRWVCETIQRTYVRDHRIDGCVPLQAVTGETIDISEYLDFGFCDRIL